MGPQTFAKVGFGGILADRGYSSTTSTSSVHVSQLPAFSPVGTVQAGSCVGCASRRDRYAIDDESCHQA